MRFVFFSVFAVLWIVMWWWTYTCHIKLVCCPQYAEHTVVAGDSGEETRPLLFRWSEPEPLSTPAFKALRDSLMSQIGENEALEITGYAFRDEVAGNPDLGLERAKAVGHLVDPGDTEKIVTQSKTANLTGDARNQLFEAISFNIVYSGPEIPDITKRRTFTYERNATRVTLTPSAESYLDSLVARLRLTDEKVRITGHSDNVGGKEANYRLGMERAGALRELLVRRGLAADRIAIESRGEEVPVASNATVDGRRQNRRAELEIIEPQ